MKLRLLIMWGVAAVVLVVTNVLIIQKERLLASPQGILLELAPVDPRSLVQGDYMALRFALANQAASAVGRSRESSDGRIVATLDERRVASFRRLHDGKPVASDEVLLRYRVREGEMKFATNAFFFQEDTAQRYEGARYGEFRVAPDGELLLTDLRDKDLKPL